MLIGDEVGFTTLYMEDRVIVRMGDRERNVLWNNDHYSLGPRVRVMNDLLYQCPMGEEDVAKFLEEYRKDNAKWDKQRMKEKEEAEKNGSNRGCFVIQTVGCPDQRTFTFIITVLIIVFSILLL